MIEHLQAVALTQARPTVVSLNTIPGAGWLKPASGVLCICLRITGDSCNRCRSMRASQPHLSAAQLLHAGQHTQKDTLKLCARNLLVHMQDCSCHRSGRTADRLCFAVHTAQRAVHVHVQGLAQAHAPGQTNLQGWWPCPATSHFMHPVPAYAQDLSNSMHQAPAPCCAVASVRLLADRSP